MPELKKAELIDGVVYMPSPVTLDDHGGPHFDMICWLGLYRMATPGVRGGDDATLRLPLNNRPQPDACLIVEPSHGGRCGLWTGTLSGVPSWSAEVAATSANYDLTEKFRPLSPERRPRIPGLASLGPGDRLVRIAGRPVWRRLAPSPEGHSQKRYPAGAMARPGGADPRGHGPRRPGRPGGFVLSRTRPIRRTASNGRRCFVMTGLTGQGRQVRETGDARVGFRLREAGSARMEEVAATQPATSSLNAA